MRLHNIEIPVRNLPTVDPGFIPLGLYMDAFLKEASKPVSVAIERENGNISVFDTFLYGEESHAAADLTYLERIIKFLLWSRGGWRIFVCGDERAAKYIKDLYSETGARAFDRRTMETIYEKQFEVCSLPLADKPRDSEETVPIGGFLDGCRIGIDVGGSNRKICALCDGKIVYNVTEPWQPLDHADPDYHIAELIQSLRRAAAALPRVDAIGISTAGIYVNNRTRIASIFRNVPQQAFEEKLYRDPLTGIYNRRYYEEVARKTIGPAGVALMDVDDFKICNDTYGHYAGDMALKTVANTIQSCIRKSDLLIRYGGDEFLLVLPGIPGDFLQTKLEQICTAAQMASVPGYSHFRISLSIGGTIQSLADPMENIVRRADRLMYQAKCRKNAVMVEVPGRNLAALEKLLQNKPQILLVDDSAMNRMMLTEILGDSYHILEAENGRECMEKLQAEAGNIALVLLDINMPVMDGFEVLKAMNANHTIEDIPVIMISSEDSDATIRRSYELGASDYVNRPFDARIVYRRVTNTIKLYAKQRRLVQMVSEQIRARENNTDTLVGVLSHIVEFRNGESGAHVRHIRIITELLLRRLLEISSRYSITAEQQDMIPLASALHDIGKIGIDEKVLNKPGKLTPEEFEVMKTHSMLGAKMLHDLDNFAEQPLLQTAYEIARWHHERWDGRGYPDGLKGDEIPISAQLVSLADVYDALTSERCYKKAFSHEKAVQMILNGECGAFNPLLLQCLTDIQTDLKEELQQHN
jgi:putative two-component system response regulator